MITNLDMDIGIDNSKTGIKGYRLRETIEIGNEKNIELCLHMPNGSDLMDLGEFVIKSGNDFINNGRILVPDLCLPCNILSLVPTHLPTSVPTDGPTRSPTIGPTPMPTQFNMQDTTQTTDAIITTSTMTTTTTTTTTTTATDTTTTTPRPNSRYTQCDSADTGM